MKQEEYKLPLSTLLLWQLRFTAAAVPILCITGFYSERKKSLLIAVAIMLFVLFAVIFWYLPKRYDSYVIRCFEDAVEIKNGVIIKSTHVFPFARLIYIKKTVTPLSKKFGLTSLTFKAARNTLFVPELSDEDARRLIKDIGEI